MNERALKDAIGILTVHNLTTNCPSLMRAARYLCNPKWYESCRCKVSTGICGCPTFGVGRLDDNGYWSIPCPHGREVHTCFKEAQ